MTQKIFILKDASNIETRNIGCILASNDKALMTKMVSDCVAQHYEFAEVYMEAGDVDFDWAINRGSWTGEFQIDHVTDDRGVEESLIELEVSYSYLITDEDQSDHNWKRTMQEVLYHIHPSASEYPTEESFKLAFEIADQFEIDYKDEHWNCPDCLNYEEVIKKYAQDWLENGAPPSRIKPHEVHGKLIRLTVPNIFKHPEVLDATNMDELTHVTDFNEYPVYVFHNENDHYCQGFYLGKNESKYFAEVNNESKESSDPAELIKWIWDMIEVNDPKTDPSVSVFINQVID